MGLDTIIYRSEFGISMVRSPLFKMDLKRGAPRNLKERCVGVTEIDAQNYCHAHPLRIITVNSTYR